MAQENVAWLGPSVCDQANQGKQSEAIGTQPNLSAAIRALNCFYSACWWSSHRKILTYENLQQPTTTYYSLKIFLAPDLCLTRSRPNPTNPEYSRPIQTKNIFDGVTLVPEKWSVLSSSRPSAP